MANIFFGIVTVLFCCIGYFLSWRFFARHKLKISIVLLIFCGFILRMFVASDNYFHKWDERYHVLVAKNMISEPFKPMLYANPVLPYDYKNWTENHIWLHKQPFPLWAIAASMKIFGVSEMSARQPSILLSTIGILLMFLLGRTLFGNRVGFISAFLYSIHGLIIELSGGRVATDHIDVFFQFFILLAVFFAFRFSKSKKLIFNILCAMSIGVAILSKWLPALTVVPLWILFVFQNKEFKKKEIIFHFLLLVSVIIIIALPWQIYIFTAFYREAHWESLYNFRHITENIEGHAKAFYYHFDMLRIIYGELVYIPIIWFLYKSFKKPTRFRRLAISLWFIIPFCFFSFAKTKMQAYTIFAAPAIFIITAVFWNYLYFYINKFKFKWLNICLLILLIALPVRYSFERIKAFQKSEKYIDWVMEIKSLSNTVESKKVVLFNTEHPIETMIYTNIVAYGHCPDIEAVLEIKRRGYEILIVDNGKLPENISGLEGIRIINSACTNKYIYEKKH